MHGVAEMGGQRRVAGETTVLAMLSAGFFASGFAALLYQVIWQRMLGLFAGSDAVTAALVVGAFLAGLGLGSLLAGFIADKLNPRRAAWAFIGCEVGIALFALASRPFFYDVVVERLGPMMTEGWQIFAVCFLGLLAPTLLMGLSLPLLARAVVARLETAAGRIGWLYGINTLGAAAGTLLGGFWLVGTVGFEAALWVGAGLNLFAAAVTLAVLGSLPRTVAVTPAATGPATESAGDDGLGLPAWTFLVFLSGFFIIALEILWVRVLGIAGQANAYSFSLILGIFLAADGLGVVVGARWVKRVADTRAAFFHLQSWAALYALVTLLGFRQLYGWPAFDAFLGMETFRHGPVEISIIAGLGLVLIGPPAFLLGMSFPVVQKAVQRDLASVGFRVGLVQVGNIAGNAAGSLIGGLVLLHLLGTAGTARAVGLLALGMLVLWLVLAARGGVHDRRGAALAAGLAVAVALFPTNTVWWSRIHGVGPGQTAFVAEDRSGVVVLRLQDDSGPMFITGHTQSRLPFWPHHYFLGALGPALHPSPRDVLVIGSGSGGTPFAAGWNPETRHIRAIELIAPVYDVIRDYAVTKPGSALAALTEDKRFDLVVGDGRREIFVSGARYDVIEADAILPQTSHSGMLYSVEFLALVRGALKPGGLFVQWAPTERVARSFLQAFPHVLMLQPISLVIGSDQPIPFDAEALKARFGEPAFKAWAARAGVDISGFPGLFADPPRIWRPETPRGGPDEVNTDLFPRDEFYLNNTLRGAAMVTPR
ncbi:fused MFS/spermidine synthase [Elioraea sp.]|uniref:fused MFS/spermidine synthase n=1 Tax=Elioraea sp. TaxID=2185103 RepID=UPI0025B8DB66|nr:fused MFS/spermidine synthase [Elioraea sp.]